MSFEQMKIMAINAMGDSLGMDLNEICQTLGRDTCVKKGGVQGDQCPYNIHHCY